MVTLETLQKAAEWAAELYESRTIEVAKGTASIHYVHPAYRVGNGEVADKFGFSYTDLPEYQPLFHAALRRRGLYSVMKDWEKSLDWYNRVKKSSQLEA
jgi:hypothetical protein